MAEFNEMRGRKIEIKENNIHNGNNNDDYYKNTS